MKVLHVVVSQKPGQEVRGQQHSPITIYCSTPVKTGRLCGTSQVKKIDPGGWVDDLGSGFGP